MDELYEQIGDLMEHPVVQQMKQYPQHGNISCYQHCLHVAWYNYRICKMLGLNAREAARAGMLHDLFLYDWHTHFRDGGKRFHGLTHPKTALNIAGACFQLSPLEEEMILKHMWPLTVIPPRHLETVMICIVDKYCSLYETAAGRKLLSKGV